MFVGSQYCGHCGVKAVIPDVQNGAAGDCPRCRRTLDYLKIEAITLRECQRCGGMWSDVETFESVCADRERQSTVLGFVARRELAAAPPTKISYVPCPECKQLMNRSNFARASGVIIDTCKRHGVWFDADELPRIIGFIQKGGMEMARQRERNEIEQEREHLKEERRKLGALARGADTDDYAALDNETVVQHFIRNLFD
jgi:Zn-finger nucleic acid-binding protein